MALKLGTLEVDIDGNTAGLEQAETVVKKSSTRMNDVLKKTETQTKNNTKALGGLGRKSGQAGIQIQQFVGQIQGGQNAMLALSQQSADLGFVLGAPLLGAIVGIGATIVGSLLPALFNSKAATDELEGSIKSLDEVSKTTAEQGVNILTEKLVRLAAVSERAARIQIAKGIVDASKAVESAGNLIQESLSDQTDSVFDLRLGLEELGSVYGLVSEQELDAAVGKRYSQLAFIVEDLQDKFKLTKEEAEDLTKSMLRFSAKKNVENAEALEKVVISLGLKYQTTNKELVEFSAGISKNVQVMKLSTERSKDLKDAQKDLHGAIEEAKDSTGDSVGAIEKYIKALEAQVGALGLTGESLAEYEAGVLGATGADKDQIIALKAKIDAFKEAQQAVKDDIKARETAQKNLDKIKAGGLSEEGKTGAVVESKVKALRESLELEQITQQEFDDLTLSAAQEQSDRLLEISRNRRLQELQLQQQALGNLSSFHSAATDVIKAAGKEGTAVAKAAFLAGKAIQVAQIIAATQVAAIQAGAVASAGGPLPFFGTVAAIETMGFATAGLVAGLSVGEAFEQGGIVGGHSMTGDRVPARVNSGEMILTTRQQSKLFSMANGGGDSAGSEPKVNIINNGAPIDVQGSSMSNGELTLMIDNKIKASQNQINQSLASGRGDTFQALQKGSRVERRL